MVMFSLLLLFLGLWQIYAAGPIDVSFACSEPNSLLANPAVVIQPNPPKNGNPVAVTISGTGLKDVGNLTFAITGDFKVGIFPKIPLDIELPLSFTPLIPKGPIVIAIGPGLFKELALSVTLDIKVVVTSLGRPVTCATITGVIEAPEPTQAALPAPEVNPFIDVSFACTRSPSIASNLKTTITPNPPIDGQPVNAVISADLSASVAKFVLKATGDLKLGILPAIKVHATVPVALTPLIPQGPLNVWVGPLIPKPNGEKLTLDVTVDLTTPDSKEIACVEIITKY